MPKLNLLSGSYSGPNGEGLKLLSFEQLPTGRTPSARPRQAGSSRAMP